MADTPDITTIAPFLRPLATVTTNAPTDDKPSTREDIILMVAQNLHMNARQHSSRFTDDLPDILLKGTGTFRLVKNKMVLSDVIISNTPLPESKRQESDDKTPRIDRDWYGGLDGDEKPADATDGKPNAEFIAWVQSYRPPASQKITTRSYRWLIHRDPVDMDYMWSAALHAELTKVLLCDKDRHNLVGRAQHIDIGVFVYFYPSGHIRHWDLNLINDMHRERLADTSQWKAYAHEIGTLLNTLELTPGAWRTSQTTDIVETLQAAGLEWTSYKFDDGRIIAP